MWNGVGVAIRVTSNQTVFDVAPTYTMGTEKHQGLATVGWQFHHLFVRHEVQLVKNGVVFGQVLVLADPFFLQILAEN